METAALLERQNDLEEYGGLAASQKPILRTVFPRDSAEEERLFELLQKAYVNARYNKKYEITKDEKVEHKSICKDIKFPNAEVRSIKYYYSLLSGHVGGNVLIDDFERLKKLKGTLL